MWNTLETVAKHNRFNVDDFVEYALDNCKKYHLDDHNMVGTWYVDDLIADFKNSRTAAISSRIAESFLADRVARVFVGIDFPTQDALNQYKRDHDVRKNTKLKVLNHKAPPAGKSPDVKQDESKVTMPTKKDETADPKPKKRIQYKAYIPLDKPKLVETLTKGHFTLISAGRNKNYPKEAGLAPDDEFFHKRHEKLRADLEKAGLPYTEVVGHYGGPESTFLVFHDDTELTPKTQKSLMVHHKDGDESKSRRKMLEELGKKFNQDSVLHAGEGRNDLVFTTGEKAGKTCGGNGWKEAPKAKDNYTDIELTDQKHTKFKLDIHECFERGML